eukprot:3454474-Prymnesium_polylepis.1
MCIRDSASSGLDFRAPCGYCARLLAGNYSGSAERAPCGTATLVLSGLRTRHQAGQWYCMRRRQSDEKHWGSGMRHTLRAEEEQSHRTAWAVHPGMNHPDR